MEITLLICTIIGLIVAFTCIYCYRRGVRDGMCVKNDRFPEKIIQKPEFMQTKDEKQQTEEEKNEKRAFEEMQDNLQKLWDYQPKYTARRE